MPSPVDDYLTGLPAGQRDALAALRRTIRSAAPGAEEAIRAGVPAFRYRGRPLVSMGAAKGHVALYIMYGGVLASFEDRLRGFDTSATVVRFQPSDPLPDPLVVDLVMARRQEIDDEEAP